MGRKLAIGAAWWLATAYALNFGAAMYGYSAAVAPLAALVVASLIALTRPAPARRRPADLRRIYRPEEESLSGQPDATPVTNA